MLIRSVSQYVTWPNPFAAKAVAIVLSLFATDASGESQSLCNNLQILGPSAWPKTFANNDLYVREGERVELHCKAPSREHNPTWLNNLNEECTRDKSEKGQACVQERLRSDSVIQRMSIEKAEKFYNGLYACNSTVTPAWLCKTAIVFIHVLDNAVQPMPSIIALPPAPETAPNETAVNRIEPINLNCEFSLSRIVKPEWTYNGNPVSPDRTKILEKGTLQIREPDQESSGIYGCTFSYASGGDAEVHHTNIVEVHGGPHILKHQPIRADLLHGTNAIVQCEVVGYPTPEVRWFHYAGNWSAQNGEEIIDLEGIFRGYSWEEIYPLSNRRFLFASNNGVPNARLVISNVQFGDEGFYKCEAAPSYRHRTALVYSTASFIQYMGVSENQAASFVRTFSSKTWLLVLIISLLLLCSNAYS